MKVWDLHCDTLSELRCARREGREVRFDRNDLHLSLEKMEKGDYMLQCMAAFVDLGDKSQDPLCAVLEMADLFEEILQRYPERVAPVYRAEDIDRNAAQGKISLMLTVEEGGACRGSLGVLRSLYRLGVRMMTLTWNHPNELGWPNRVPFTPETERGLTERGREFVAEMERLHMLVDVSHLSDAGFWDVARMAKRPFVASHSNARGLCGSCRNLTDEMIAEMGRQGCLVGLNYCPDFLEKVEPPCRAKSTAAQLARHARYIAQRGGAEILALGSDFDGIGGELELKDASRLPLLEGALRAEGFSEREIEGIFFANARRFFTENL